jgi:hypothetical protein
MADAQGKTPEQLLAEQAQLDKAKVADAERAKPFVIPDDQKPPAVSLAPGSVPLNQPADQVKAEQASLTHEQQALATDRDARQLRHPGESDQPTDEHLDGPDTAAARLRAFEDERFGEDAVRIGGHIERGSGSPYAAMSEPDKLHYTALERLVVAEQKFNDAAALAAQAEADRAAAEEHLSACEKSADDARTKAAEQAAARQARADAKANKQPAAA